MSIRSNDTYAIEKNYWDIFNEDVFNKICSYLPFEDILHLGASSKNFHYDLSQKNWKHLKFIKYFDFSWSDSEKKSFLLCKAIHAYVQQRKINISHEEATNIYKRFESLMIECPSFGAYLWSDLTHLCPTLASYHYDQFQKNIALLQTPLNNVKCGGDFLLRALYKITCCEFDVGNISFAKLGEITTLCMKAIDAGATCSNYLAYKILNNKCDLDWHLTLGLLSQSKGDCRALDQLFLGNHGKAIEYYNKGMFYPSVLGSIFLNTPLSAFGANLQSNKLELELILKQTIEAYGEKNIPSFLFDHTDFLITHTIEEGFEPLEKFIGYDNKIYKQNNVFTNSYDSIDAGFKKNCNHFQLGEWKEAEKWLDKPYVAKDPAIPTLIRKAYVKFKLEKWKEAQDLFQCIGVLSRMKQVSSSDMLGIYSYIIGFTPQLKEGRFKVRFFLDYAHINLKLKNCETALEYYEKAMTIAFGDGFDYDDESFNECKLILDKIASDFEKEGISIPPKSSLIVFQARVEAYYKNWDKVLNLLEDRLSHSPNHHNDTFASEWMQLAVAYLKNENWKLAERTYEIITEHFKDSIHQKYLQDTSDDVSINVDFDRDYTFVKIKLGKLEEAESICNQIIQKMVNAYYEDVSSFCYEITMRFCQELSDLLEGNIPLFLQNWIAKIKAGTLELLVEEILEPMDPEFL